MAKAKQPKEDLVITTIRAPRPFWAKVRNQAFVEGLGTGELILKVLAEYLKQKAAVMKAQGSIFLRGRVWCASSNRNGEAGPREHARDGSEGAEKVSEQRSGLRGRSRRPALLAGVLRLLRYFSAASDRLLRALADGFPVPVELAPPNSTA